MSKALGFIFALLSFVGTCEAAVFSWTVQTNAMIGEYSGYLANVSSSGTPTGDFNPNPTSYHSGDSSNGRLLGEAYNPVSYSSGSGPSAANYQVHSKVDAIWGPKLDFTAQSEVVSNPTPYTVTVKSRGEFFFTVTNSGTGTYKVTKSGNLQLFKKDESDTWQSFADTGSIVDVKGLFKIGFKIEFVSSSSPTNTGNTTGSLKLEYVASSPPVVPEPASLAIFGTLGFAGFVARRFRKK